MKVLPTRLLVLLAVTSLFGVSAPADEAAYAKILKERDAVLSQIVTDHEARFASGIVSDETLQAARLALWSFRRDTAAAPVDKIKQQELIVGLQAKKLAILKGRAAAGVVGRQEILLATDALLQAQQTLEELRLSPKQD
jgi:hypothetical protein